MSSSTREQFGRRKVRVRLALKKKNQGHPRLSVFRSNNHIYAQIIDDEKRLTLTSASSLEKEMKEKLKAGRNKEAAELIGKLIAERAIKAGVKNVVFDRGGYLFHGRVKALADAAREVGLIF